MCRPLPVILAGLLIDNAFRSALVAVRTNRAALRPTLAGYGFYLDPDELTSAQMMLEDFDGSAMDTARTLIQEKCPDWPCSKFMISGD